MCLNNVNQQPFLDTSSIAYSDLSAGSCWPRRRTTFRGGCYMARDPLRKCQPRSTEQLLLATNSLDCKTEIPRRMQLESAVPGCTCQTLTHPIVQQTKRLVVKDCEI